MSIQNRTESLGVALQMRRAQVHVALSRCHRNMSRALRDLRRGVTDSREPISRHVAKRVKRHDRGLRGFRGGLRSLRDTKPPLRTPRGHSTVGRFGNRAGPR